MFVSMYVCIFVHHTVIGDVIPLALAFITISHLSHSSSYTSHKSHDFKYDIGLALYGREKDIKLRINSPFSVKISQETNATHKIL